jgi:Type II secretion system (T2SS), protein G
MQTDPVSTLAKDWPLPEPGDPTTPSSTTTSGTNPTSAGLAIPSSPEEGVDPASLTKDDITKVLEYGEFVKFIHNAVEWENLLFFAYPYFWDTVDNWPFKRFLLHPDPVHREFLRAGAVRVVLTIRSGFEDAFLRLTATGDQEASDDAVAAVKGTPYVSLGQQIHNQDRTNYQNIPPANPDRTARPLLYALQQAAWNDMQAIIAALEAFKNDHKGRYPPGPEAGLPKTLKDFLLSKPQTVPGTGDPAVPGSGDKSFAAMLWDDLQTVPLNPGGNFDDPNATFTDPWGNPYHYTTPSPTNQVLHGDYELVSYGSNNAEETDPDDPLSENITSWAEGLLVAQWFEYTPTSALDVSVDTTLTITSPPLPG